MTTRKQMAANHGLSRYAIDRIRKSSESRQVLADRYGISRYAVDKIKKGLPARRGSNTGNN
jgi:hypothetical protein